MPFPFLAAAGLLVGALGARSRGNAAAAAKEDENATSIYEIERKKAVDQAEFDLGQAATEDRIRYANAIGKAKGFVLPQMDNSSRRGVKLVQPKTPTLNKPKRPGLWDTILGAGQGMISGLTTEANLNAARGNPLPGSDSADLDSDAAALTAGSAADEASDLAGLKGLDPFAGVKKRATSPGQPVGG